MLVDIKKEFTATALYTGISEPSTKVLQTIAKIKRHLFVNQKYKHLAYKNIPLPIENNQTISQPFIVALMTELLDLQFNDRVLEIGTGSGYQTVILAMLAAKIYTIEFFTKLFNNAIRKFKQLNINNIYALHSDGSNGWQEYAPYNKIIVTANMEHIPNKLINQLSPNGLMVTPVGKNLEQQLYKITKSSDNINIKQEAIMPVVFVPIISR